MPTLRRALSLIVLAGACHRPAAAPLNPRAEVAVTVENQNFLDMDVFLIRGGQRVRLGMVPGRSSPILMVRPELIGYGTGAPFELHPIGGPGAPPRGAHPHGRARGDRRSPPAGPP